MAINILNVKLYESVTCILFKVIVMAGIILIKETMTKDVKKVRTDTSMQEVIATMLKFDISSVVVVQKDRPIGLITHKDILLKMIKPGLLPNVLTAINIMSTPIITVREEQSIDEAAKIMAEKGLKKLPVVKNDKLVGIITSTDIIREQPRLTKILEELCKPQFEK